MAAHAAGDGFKSGPQRRDVGGEAGEGSRVCGAVAVFFDEGSQGRVAVEGGAAEAGVRGDLGEGDWLLVGEEFGAGLLDYADGFGGCHPRLGPG